MTQQVLNEAVARMTGEDLGTIESIGFVPLTRRPIELETDDDRPPMWVDWDAVEQERTWRGIALCPTEFRTTL